MAFPSKDSSDQVLPPLGMIIGQVDYADLDRPSSDLSNASPVVADHADEVLAYTAQVTNTGTVDLTDVVVKNDSGVTLGTVVDLAPGKSETFTAQYVVKQADIDAGHPVVITVHASDEQGDKVLAAQNLPVLQLPSLSIVQTYDTEAYDVRNARAVDHALQTITYTVSITNTGNETLTGVKTDDGQSIDSLAVGQTWTYTTSHKVTQSEVDDQSKGIATTVSVSDDQGDQKSASTTTPVVQNPMASILFVNADHTSVDHAGQVINFTAIEANNGNVTLDVTATDKLNGQWTTLGTDTLVPYQAKFLHFSYTVTQADMDAGLSIGALVEAVAPGAAFGDNSWKQTQVTVDQKATVNVENLESFDGGQTWYFHQMPGFATQANVQAAFKAAGGVGTVVGYTTAPTVKAGTQVLQAALVTDTGNVTEHKLSVRGFTFDSSDLAPGQSMLSHTVSTVAGSTSGTYSNSVSVSGNHLNSYGWGVQVPFGLTSNTDTASYSVGTVSATTISVALNTPTQPSFVNNSPATSSLDALTAQVRADMADAAARIQAATDYVNSLPPLPTLPSMPWQTPTPTAGSLSSSDVQAAVQQMQSLGLHS